MSRRKRYIAPLTAEQKQALEQGYKYGKSHDFRVRCHCILLSAGGKPIAELIELFDIGSRVTIYSWFNRWEAEGIEGLKIRTGRGRKRKLDFANQSHVKQAEQSLKQENRKINQVQGDLESKLGVAISKRTLRRFFKRLGTDTNASENA